MPQNKMRDRGILSPGSHLNNSSPILVFCVNHISYSLIYSELWTLALMLYQHEMSTGSRISLFIYFLFGVRGRGASFSFAERSDERLNLVLAVFHCWGSFPLPFLERARRKHVSSLSRGCFQRYGTLESNKMHGIQGVGPLKASLVFECSSY